MLRQKIWALFSSQSESVGWYIRSLADQLNIPHISVYWDYRSPYLNNVNHNVDQLENLLTSAPLPTSPQPQNFNTGYIFPYTNQAKPQDQRPRFQSPSELERQGIGVPVNYHANQNRQRDGNQFSSDFPNEQPALNKLGRGNVFTINLYPETGQLSQAFMDFIESRNWKSFTLIYERDDALIKLKNLLSLAGMSGSGSFSTSDGRQRRKIKVTTLKFDDRTRDHFTKTKWADTHFYHLRDGENKEPVNYAYRKLLKDVKRTEHNVVLSLSADKVIQLLRQVCRESHEIYFRLI